MCYKRVTRRGRMNERRNQICRETLRRGWRRSRTQWPAPARRSLRRRRSVCRAQSSNASATSPHSFQLAASPSQLPPMAPPIADASLAHLTTLRARVCCRPRTVYLWLWSVYRVPSTRAFSRACGVLVRPARRLRSQDISW